MTETYIIPEGQNVTDIKDVKVKFTTIIEVPKEQIYSEQDCLNTIASLEKDKEDYCAIKNAEIEINNQMLIKIRAVERPINIIE
jgi:hypothetical protein